MPQKGQYKKPGRVSEARKKSALASKKARDKKK